MLPPRRRNTWGLGCGAQSAKIMRNEASVVAICVVGSSHNCGKGGHYRASRADRKGAATAQTAKVMSIDGASGNGNND